MKTRYFAYESDPEIAYELCDLEDALSENSRGVLLLEMKREYGGEMWCKEYQRPVEKRNKDCGWNDCSEYSPCNYIKGRCRFLVNCFVETGKTFLLTKTGLEEIK